MKNLRLVLVSVIAAIIVLSISLYHLISGESNNVVPASAAYSGNDSAAIESQFDTSDSNVDAALPLANDSLHDEKPNTSRVIMLPSEEVVFVSGAFGGEGASINEVLDRVRPALSKSIDNLSVSEAVLLGELSGRCETQMSDVEIEQFKQTTEETLLELGVDNAGINNMLETTDRHRDLCKALENEGLDFSAHAFHARAAELDDARSKVLIATDYPPRDLNTMAEQEKSDYLRAAGKMLVEAQAMCEPAAFRALGLGKYFGEGALWSYPDGGDDRVRRLANLFALREYASSLGTTGYFYEVDEHANDLIQSMSVDQIGASQQMGEHIFQKGCK